jgi:hypothetical protein
MMTLFLIIILLFKLLNDTPYIKRGVLAKQRETEPSGGIITLDKNGLFNFNSFHIESILIRLRLCECKNLFRVFDFLFFWDKGG